MLDRLLDFIANREPVASATGIAGLVSATLGVVVALGVDIDPELIAAVGVLAAALAGWLARKKAYAPATVQAIVAGQKIPDEEEHTP